MNKLLSLFALLVAPLFATCQAQASAVEFGVVGALSEMNLSQSPAPTAPASDYSAASGLGLGVTGSFNLIPKFSIDASLVYDSRNISQTIGRTEVDLGFHYLELPVVARYWIIPMVNVGAGLYYAIAMGDVNTESTTVGTTVSTSQTYGNSGLKTSDMGFVLSAGAKIPLSGMNILFDVNYLHGLKDISAVPGTIDKWSGFEFLAGLSFSGL